MMINYSIESERRGKNEGGFVGIAGASQEKGGIHPKFFLFPGLGVRVGRRVSRLSDFMKAVSWPSTAFIK